MEVNKTNSIHIAKSNLLFNICSNIALILVSSLISILLTPYFIKQLGVSVFGMIPLVVSFISYVKIFTNSIAESVNRFVCIKLEEGETNGANIYFNSAFGLLSLFCLILLLPITLVFLFFVDIFNVPVGHERDSQFLFLGIMLSVLISSMTGPLLVSFYVKHNFGLKNLIDIISRFIRVSCILFSFFYFDQALKYVGLSYIMMMVFVFMAALYYLKISTPEIKISRKYFDWNYGREMLKMGGWIIINEVGALLYLGISYLLLNLFLGSEACGRYGAVACLVALMGAFGSAINSIFSPIIYSYIAQNDIKAMSHQLARANRYLALLMALPIGLCCGLSKPLLLIWLGNDFVDLVPLVFLLLIPWVFNIAVRPMLAVFRGLNSVKIPAIATLLGGIANVILAILFIFHTNLGIYSAALSIFICLVIKNVFFNTFYTAKLTNTSGFLYLKSLCPSLLVLGMIISGGLFIQKCFELSTFQPFAAAVTGLIIFYLIIIMAVTSKDDKRFFLSVLKRGK